jgi:hypothetical protein
MIRYLRSAALMKIAGGLLIVTAAYRSAVAQEFLPDPAVSQARSANLANGGVESEWEYHRRANLPSFRTSFVPISKFAGGSGYCTPAMHPPYYGCDTSGCRRSSRGNTRGGTCNCR